MWSEENKNQQHKVIPIAVQQTQQQQNGFSTKTLGMTSAISTAGPKPEDFGHTIELEKALKPYMVFETESELNHRMEILAKLNILVKQWVKKVSIGKNMPPDVAEKLGGKIYTFGSYRLGVHHKGADIDALCVVPRNIERSDYFVSFMEVLKAQSEVTECRVCYFLHYYLIIIINSLCHNFRGFCKIKTISN